MNKAQAVKLFKALNDAERGVNEAIATMDGKVAGDAAGLCHHYLTDVAVRLWLEVLSPLVKENSELMPAMPQGGGAEWAPTRIPERELEGVLAALAQLRETLLVSIPVVDEGATTPGESVGYRSALVRLGEKVDQAMTNIRDLAE